jgi:carbon-monoxide dehydrogenase medium subunit
MTLLPSMKHRLAAPTALIDVARLPEMIGVRPEGDHWWVGAATRHQDVAAHAGLQQAIPGLATLAGLIGDPQVRARGTLGGSLANNDPSADYPSAALALQAQIITDRRTIEAGDFFQGMFATALEPGELIRAVRFMRPRRAAYAKFAQAASGYAMAGVMVAEFADGVRVAVTGAGPGVFRWIQAEQALSARLAPESLEPLTLTATGLNADLHASAEYRANLVKVMARQAVSRLTGAAR